MKNLQNGHILLALAILIVTGCLILNRSHMENYFQSFPASTSGRETTPINRLLRKWPEKLTSGLDFIPLHVAKCEDLFTTEAVLPSEIIDAIMKLDVQLKKFVKGVLEGYAVMFREKPIAHARLVRMPFISTVCETGFNAGHSTLTWLLANPNVTVYSFDIGVHEYSRPMAEYIGRLFPGRLRVTWGDSTVTLPKFHKEFPDVVCDLVSIDGGHTDLIAQQDFDNFKAMATCNNVLIYDDYPMNVPALGPTWEGKKRAGEVTEFFKCTYQAHPWGFSVGRFLLQKCAK